MRTARLSAGLLGGLFVALALQPLSAQDSPVGTWEVTIKGSDRGIAFFTFAEDGSLTGYGITRDSFGLFDITGNWELDEDTGKVVGSYVQVVGGDSVAVSFYAQVQEGKKFRAYGDSTDGRVSLRGSVLSALPPMAGTWESEVQRRGKKSFETWQVAPVDGMPGLFTMGGNGQGPDGTFTLDGFLIVSSRNNTNLAYQRFFTAGGEATNSLFGKVNPGKPDIRTKGKDALHAGLRAESTPQP